MHRTHYLLISLLLLSACGVGEKKTDFNYSKRITFKKDMQRQKAKEYCKSHKIICPPIQFKHGKKLKKGNFFLTIASIPKDIVLEGIKKRHLKYKDQIKKIYQNYKVVLYTKSPSVIKKQQEYSDWLKSPNLIIKEARCKTRDDTDCKHDNGGTLYSEVKVEFYKLIDLGMQKGSIDRPNASAISTKSPPDNTKPEDKTKRKQIKPPRRPQESKQKKKPKPPKYKKKTIPYNWMLVYDISTESKLSTKNTLGDLLMKDKKLNVKLGALVFSAGVDMYKTKKLTAMELHARQPAIQHANITSSSLALKKKKRLIDRRKINSLVYIGPDALSMSEEQLKEMKPVKNPKKLVYLIVDEDGCKKSKIKSILKSTSKEINKQFREKSTIVSCVQEKDLGLVLKSLPNSKITKVKIEQ